MRIFIEPSSYRCDNLGDVAMLDVAVHRLRSLWPEASIRIHSFAPRPLLAIDPALEIVDPIGAAGWNWETRLVGEAPVAALAAVALDVSRRFRRRWPRLAALTGEVILQARRFGRRRVARYLAAIGEADLVLVTGAGSLNDAFRRNAFRVLESLELGMVDGAVTALVGQGIGPMRDEVLLRRAALVLPRVDLLALREGVVASALLAAIGMPSERSTVTGDDAIAMAYAARPDSLGSAIGVNLRVSRYSGAGSALVDAVGRVVREAARRHATALVPVPIARDAETDDLPIARRLIGEEVWDQADHGPSNVSELLQIVRGCRVVVAGSYHACVLALSMGIPAVAIAASEYYIDKFRGPADQFGPACRVEVASHPEFHTRLAMAIDQSWLAADETRGQLLNAAARQVALGEAAYRHLFDLVERRRLQQP